MKKGKVLGKSQLVLAVMIVALGAAVWLNMRYQPNENKYLGEAEFVDGAAGSESLETSANAEDYFTKSRRERTEQN